MNKDLDAKLEKILGRHIYTIRGGDKLYFSLNATIAQIHKAFADEGYVKEIDISFPWITSNPPPHTTGQEWYERFKKEMYFHITPKDTDRDYEILDRKAILEAAKRASGVSDV